MATPLPVLQDINMGEAMQIANVIEYDYNISATAYPWVCQLENQLSFNCPFDGYPMVVNMGLKRVGCRHAPHCKAFSIDLAVYQILIKKGYLDLEKVPQGFKAVFNGKEVIAAPKLTDLEMTKRFAIPICKHCGGCRLFTGTNSKWANSYGVIFFRCAVMGMHVDKQDQLCKRLNSGLKEFVTTKEFEAAEEQYGELRNKWGLVLQPFNLNRYMSDTVKEGQVTGADAMVTCEDTTSIVGLELL